jgi:predicted site-specific integrase-resolvase
MNMRVAIYSRVSTDKQDTRNQLVQLRAFAATQDWTVVREYVDIASGKNGDRQQFKALFPLCPITRENASPNLVFESHAAALESSTVPTLTMEPSSFAA